MRKEINMSIANLVTIDQIKTHPKVDHVDDGRESGQSIIITLKQGWTVDPTDDARYFAEDTPEAVLEYLESGNITEWSGPYRP
jgi:hypothetical protein